MLEQEGFDLGGPYLVAGCVDHPLEPVDHEEVAVFVDVSDIAGAKVALAGEFDERVARGVGSSPVAFEDLRATEQDFAG